MSTPDSPHLESQAPVSIEPSASVVISLDPSPGVGEAVPAIAAPAFSIDSTEQPVWSGWDVLLIAGLTIVTMLLFQIIVIVIAWKLEFPHSNLADVAQKPILLLISQFMLYAAVAALMIFLVEVRYRTRFWSAIRWNWPKSSWRFLAAGGALLLGLSLLQNLLPMPKDTAFEHLFDRPRDAYLLALLAVTLGPLMEELFFRGFMYPVLARRLGALWAILLTALPFGLIHLPQYGWAWGAGLVIFLVGVACGAVRAVTRSVGSSFLVHAGYNGAQMLIALIMTRGFQHMERAVAVSSLSLR